MDDKLKNIDISFISKRIKYELLLLKKSEIYVDDNDVDIIKSNSNYKKEYQITIKNNNDKQLYTFIISPNYPFIAPKLIINNIPYINLLTFKTQSYQNLLYKYKRKNCFCCDSIVCGENWGPQISLLNIINEVAMFHNECKEISIRIVVKIIKNKYLIDDINILEWLL